MSASIGIGTNNNALTITDPNKSYFSGQGAMWRCCRPCDQRQRQHRALFLGGGTSATATRTILGALCHWRAGYVQLSGYYLKLTDYINPNAATLYNFAPYVAGYLTPAQQPSSHYLRRHGIRRTMALVNLRRQLATNLPLGAFTPRLNA